ncbi:hypothetical protein ACOXXX_18425, partial [Thalassococcus sp. BH17M4-6]
VPARDWLTARAEDGLRGAQAALGALLLETPDITPEDQARANDWRLRAAKAGDVATQALLGQAYASGADGLDQDYVAAHAWLNLAGAAGHAEAAETREVIAALMTPEQIAQAQARARDLHAAILARTPRTRQTVRGSE